MARKQIQRAEALRDIASIRDRLITLKEHMEPLAFGLAQEVNICLHSLRTFEDQVNRDRWLRRHAFGCWNASGGRSNGNWRRQRQEAMSYGKYDSMGDQSL